MLFNCFSIFLNRSFKLFVIPVLLFFSSFEAVTNDEVSTGTSADHITFVNQDNRREVEITEKFLQRQVPGLEVTYREVFNAIIKEGHSVYMKGGFFRDLLDDEPKEPTDVDFGFSCSREELINIIEKYKWKYIAIPGSIRLIIGDSKGQFLEGVQLEIFKPKDKNKLEYTVNSIFYDVNARQFIKEFAIGIEDLKIKKLRVVSDDWKSWLYFCGSDHHYDKIFRFWRMVGKRYAYQISLENLFKEEITKVLNENPDEFQKELLYYASKHFYCYDELVRGCNAIMGREWCELHLELFYAKIEEKKIEMEIRLEDSSVN